MENEMPIPQEKPKKSVAGVINVIINVILVIAILIAAVCTYVSFVSTSGNGVPNLLGYEIFSVQTDSMYPTLQAGDLVIDRAIRDTSSLRKGDIITYWTVIGGERVLNTHRINEIYDGGTYRIFETKGDNNNAADALTVHESEVVGVYSSHVAGLGKVLDYLQTSTGFLIVVVVPVGLFFLFHLIQFFRVLFEYQNVKSRLKYQEELDARGVNTDPALGEKEETPVVDKAALEAQIREQLKAEMMAEMLAEMKKKSAEEPENAPEAAAETAENAEKGAEAPAEADETASAEETVPAEAEETVETAEAEPAKGPENEE